MTPLAIAFGLIPVLAELLPHTIGPYVSLMMVGLAVGVLGHLSRSKWLVAIGVILVFLAAFLFPLALNVTEDPPPVLQRAS